MNMSGDVLCPIECTRAACPTPDFVERNGTWLLTVLGIGTGVVGSLLAFMLKSRCHQIRCWGIECNRTVMSVSEIKEMEAKKAEEESSNA